MRISTLHQNQNFSAFELDKFGESSPHLPSHGHCCWFLLPNMKANTTSVISCNLLAVHGISEGTSRNFCGAGWKYLLDREASCRIVAAQHGLHFGFWGSQGRGRARIYPEDRGGCPEDQEQLELWSRECPLPSHTHTNRTEVFTELHAYFSVCQTLPVCGLLFDCKFE